MESTKKVNPNTDEPKKSVSWRVIFAGGFIAARVGVSLTDIDGVVQGIMTWALYTFLSVWLLTSAVGTIISGVGSALGGVISTTGEAAGAHQLLLG